MAERAVHPAAVFLPVLMTDKTDLRRPGCQTGLIWTGVACGTPSRMSQLCHMLGTRVLRVAEATVLIRRVVDGVTLCTSVLANRHGWSLMAEVAGETRVQVGLVDKAPRGKA